MNAFNIPFTIIILYIAITSFAMFALNYKHVEIWLYLSHLVNMCTMCWT